MSHTPNPWSAPLPDARKVQSNGLYAWDPARDESPYWALPWPWSQEQAEINRATLVATVRKDRE